MDRTQIVIHGSDLQNRYKINGGQFKTNSGLVYVPSTGDRSPTHNPFLPENQDGVGLRLDSGKLAACSTLSLPGIAREGQIKIEGHLTGRPELPFMFS